MRRTLAVLALSGLLAGVAGSAAALTVNGGVIQAGESTVACDINGINANYGLEVDDNTVRTVRIDGVDPACQGAEMFVKLYNASWVPLFSGHATVGESGTVPTMNIASPYLQPENIEHIKVWIEG